MNRVTTVHENDGLVRGEHVLAAYWTVSVCRTFYAFVVVGLCDRYARTTGLWLRRLASHNGMVRASLTCTYLAVEEVLVQPMPNSADTTVITVIYGLVYVVTPQFADVAIVLSRTLATVHAGIGRLLRVTAQHAQHVFGQLPRQDVLLDLVMAQPAGVPFLASRTLELDVPSVVQAAQ